LIDRDCFSLSCGSPLPSDGRGVRGEGERCLKLILGSSDGTLHLLVARAVFIGNPVKNPKSKSTIANLKSKIDLCLLTRPPSKPRRKNSTPTCAKSSSGIFHRRPAARSGSTGRRKTLIPARKSKASLTC